MPEAARRKIAADAEMPEPPPHLAHICMWWRELSSGRAAGGFSISALTWPDLRAWTKQTGSLPSPIENVLILGLDIAFRGEIQRLEGMNRPKTSKR